MRTGTAQEHTIAAGQPAASSRYKGAALLAWWIVLFAVSLLLFSPGLRAGYFSDDLLFFFNSPPAHWYDFFAIRGVAAQAYRPLEAILLSAVQRHFWFETLPIHLLALAAHAGLCCIVLAVSRQLRLSLFECWAACLFMLVAQVAAPAVLGNDTLSQSASAFFGGLSVLALFLGWRGKRAGWTIASALAYTTSLFFKETALGFLLVLLLLIATIAYQCPTWSARLKRAMLLSLPYGAASIVYAAARLHAGGAVAHSGSYQIRVGINILRNIAEFSVAAFGPMSTVDGAVALTTHHTSALALEAFGWILVVALLLAGIVFSRRSRLCLWLGAAALASLFPAYLLTHVSELYLYNAIPFLAVVFGISIGGLWHRDVWGRVAAVACAALLLGGHLYANREKAALMARNGRRAGIIYSAIARYLPSMPPDSRILLVNPPDRTPEYSVFLLKGFDVVDLGNLRIGPIWGRPDVRVELVEESEARSLESRKNRLLLRLDKEGRPQPYDPR